MSEQQPADNAVIQEVRRLLAERETKKRDIDAIDRALMLAVGLSDEDRPKKPRLDRDTFRTLCGVGSNERLSKKKR